MNLILCGHKASGKTTLAKTYSQAFNYDYLDTDALILNSQTTHSTIPNLYRALGETRFRALEARCIQTIKTPHNTIIATGGGSVIDTNNTTHLKSLGPIIYLDVLESVRAMRLKTQDTALKTHISQRDAIYPRIADYVLDATHQSIKQLITELHNYRCHHGE